jgi:hypothetical protein
MCACWLACVLPMWCVTIARVNKTRRFSRRLKAAVFPVWRLIHRYSRERQELLWGTGNELLYFASTKQLSGCSLAWTAYDYFLFYILAKTKLFWFSQGATWCKLPKTQKRTIPRVRLAVTPWLGNVLCLKTQKREYEGCVLTSIKRFMVGAMYLLVWFNSIICL